MRFISSIRSFLFATKTRRVASVCGALLLAGGAWFLWGGSSATTQSTLRVFAVTKGEVNTGIITTGTIKASQVLDLNIYKLTTRIESVPVQNGTSVKKGQLLFSFDADDASVAYAQSSLAVQQAELSLTNAQLGFTDQNTSVSSLTTDIATLEKNIAEYDAHVRAKTRDFLSDSLEAFSANGNVTEQNTRTAPSVTGLYTSSEQGEYTVEVYGTSNGGFAFRYSGLETGSAPLYSGVKAPLGSRGLYLVFPSASQIRSGDMWKVLVPNVRSATYAEAKKTYDDALLSLANNLASDKTTLANKKTLLAQAERTDTLTDRDLGVHSASLAVQKARVDLQKNADTLTERRIVAPFDGFVEGMENVVAGATPTKDTNDPIDFGSLISNDFIVSFSLGATQVDKVSLGQTVLVSLTSAPEAEPLTGTITEISSLPSSDAVPQYTVRARLEKPEGVSLRDGLLADITIVQEKKEGVLRIPSSAVSYVQGTPQVTLLTGLSEKDRTSVLASGIVDTKTLHYTTETRPVSLGLKGAYFVEVSSGLSESDLVVVTKTTTSSATTNTQEASVVRTQRTGGGGVPPRN